MSLRRSRARTRRQLIAKNAFLSRVWSPLSRPHWYHATDSSNTNQLFALLGSATRMRTALVHMSSALLAKIVRSAGDTVAIGLLRASTTSDPIASIDHRRCWSPIGRDRCRVFRSPMDLGKRPAFHGRRSRMLRYRQGVPWPDAKQSTDTSCRFAQYGGRVDRHFGYFSQSPGTAPASIPDHELVCRSTAAHERSQSAVARHSVPSCRNLFRHRRAHGCNTLPTSLHPALAPAARRVGQDLPLLRTVPCFLRSPQPGPFRLLASPGVW